LPGWWLSIPCPPSPEWSPLKPKILGRTERSCTASAKGGGDGAALPASEEGSGLCSLRMKRDDRGTTVVTVPTPSSLRLSFTCPLPLLALLLNDSDATCP